MMLFQSKFVEKGNTISFKTTLDSLSKVADKIMENGTLSYFITSSGGGLIGCVFSSIFSSLFSVLGMQIISIFLIIFGIILITGFSPVEFIKERFNEHLEKDEDGNIKKKKFKPEELTEDLGDEKIKIPKDIHKEVPINNTNVIKKVTFDDLEEPLKDTSNKSEVNNDYKLPSFKLLNEPKDTDEQASTNNESANNNIEKLEKVLEDFGIKGDVVNVNIGPTVSQYEVKIASGTRVNKITSLNREIALALSKKDVRIEAPIPGKSTVGVEFANDIATPVSFYEIITSDAMTKHMDEKLLVPLGKSIMGDIGVCKINKMPHMLIAGTTGSGKSVCVNGIIASILMRAKPDEVKLVMVDPKVVELSVYNGIPHLLCPVVTDPKKASIALAKMVQEMEDRYHRFSDTKTKNIEGYNDYVTKYNKSHKDEPMKKMPFIVADLMMVAAKEVEDSILRITQKARAAGIHLIVATQRPSTEVITGLIKANIPSRIAFAVGSGVDSRTILDQIGAEKLLGRGDMLYLPIGVNSPTRIQGSFITDDEIKRLIDYTISQQKAQYDDSLLNLEDNKDVGGVNTNSTDEDDPLYNDIVEFVITTKKASASLIQRKFKLGYNRAARIIDLLEERGIIGPANGSKPREVLASFEGEEE